MDWKKNEHLRRYADLNYKADEYYKKHKKEIDDALDDYEKYKKTKKVLKNTTNSK